MKFNCFVLLLLAACAGCNEPPNSPGTDSSVSRPTGTVTRDNTGVNVRDRDSTTVTPLDQKENKSDIEVTANIRKRVVASKMSVAAQNAKIITQDGKVTLRGPVKTAAEKQQLEQIATDVAGPKNVDSQLEIQP